MKKLLLILFAFALSGGMVWGQANVIISEVTDHATYSAEFVELYNAGNVSQDLLNWNLQQHGSNQSTVFDASITTNMSGNYTLNPGEYVVVCRGTLANLQSAYPSFNGNYFTTGNTGTGAPQMNGDEFFELFDASGVIIDNMGSSSSTTTKSKTYERKDALSSGIFDTDWVQLANTEGTPGAANATALLNDNSSGSSVADPTNFAATTNSSSQIDLSWTQNGNSDNVMVAWSSDGTFGTPTDGTSYSAGNTITGGGTVLYNGSATTYNHISLSSGTQYYYKAWSVDGSENYSSGVTDDATTYKDEPSNHVNDFTASSASSSTIDLSWTENDGAITPDGYLIKASTGSVTDPSDGTDPSDDTDLTTGSGNVKVAYGTTSYSFTNCSASTTYNFKIYPYTNSGSAIDFKTDGTVPGASATTSDPENLIISEVTDPGDDTDGRFVELYNIGTSSVDLSAGNYYLTRQANGGTQNDIALSGSIYPGETFLISYGSDCSKFNAVYSFDPENNSGFITGNGNDGYFLYKGGDHTSGTLVDAYGVIDEDGSGKAWEYTDSHAVRNSSVTQANTTWTASEWTITSANVADMTPGTHSDCITWDGTTDGAWSTTSNWVGGTTPTSSKNVKVPNGLTNTPSVDGDPATPTECNGLTIASSSSVTIPSGKALTVNGDLTNNATASGVVVESNSSGNGSLIIQGAITGNATVQRYFQGYTASSGEGWHEIGAPVAMTVAGSDFEPGTASPNLDDLYYWKESDNLWMNWKTTGFNFIRGNGYLISYESDQTSNFTGQLQNSDYSFMNLSRDDTKGSGWHLIGNGYTSAIEWDNCTGWTFYNWGHIPNVWDESAGTYVTLNTGDRIPSTNGFFLQVASGAGGNNELTIPPAARAHDATNNYKNSLANNQKYTLVLKVSTTANTFSNTIRVGFKEDATEQWDMKYDSHKLYGNEQAPELWTLSNGEEFSANTLPFSQEPIDLPLNFKAGVNGEYTLSFEGLDSFEANSNITLEDLQTSQVVDLKQSQTYTYTASTDDPKNRFMLHFYSVTSTPETEMTNDKALIYVYNNSVIIKSVNSGLNGTVEVINLLGQTMKTEKVTQCSFLNINTPFKTGIYIVRYTEQNGYTQTQKVVLN